MKNLFVFRSVVIICILFASCKKNSDDSVYIDENIGEGYLTVLPVSEGDFNLFVILGHLAPPGHVFPSDHGGFYFTDPDLIYDIYSPGNLEITNIIRLQHLSTGVTDYTLHLSSPKRRFKVVFGHLSSISESILSQIPEFDENQCEYYMAGGNQYRKCSLSVHVAAYAGEVIGTGGGLPGQYAVDFGTFDKNRPVTFATDRWTGWDYMYAVSPLDYFTREIYEILKPYCGDYNCGFIEIRTAEPIGGIIEFDVPGTLQGLWYKQNEPSNTEDYHISFVYKNTNPDVPVICWGISVKGNDPGEYKFSIRNSGLVNRDFQNIIPDGNMYRYELSHVCTSKVLAKPIILVQLTDERTLKLEAQDSGQGPPWQFTENAVHFTR